MADTFTPRGANSYDGWELTNRPAMLPFLAEYTNRNTGEKSGGFAMPSMVTEPINALVSLLNTPAGTMPNPQNPENQRNALTALLSLYGGNALGGMARGAAGRAAGHAMEMEAARPVAYSNAIDEAMSNPNMLRMMDDINYADLNRRALDQYGVGYEGLNSSQEANLRGWSDPGLFSDTGKPNPLGAGITAHKDPLIPMWHGTTDDSAKAILERGFDGNSVFMLDRASDALQYGEHALPLYVRKGALKIDADLPGASLLSVEDANSYFGNDGYGIDDYINSRRYSFGVDERGSVFDRGGKTLFSDTGRPSIFWNALMADEQSQTPGSQSQEQAPYLWPYIY